VKEDTTSSTSQPTTQPTMRNNSISSSNSPSPTNIHQQDAPPDEDDAIVPGDGDGDGADGGQQVINEEEQVPAACNCSTVTNPCSNSPIELTISVYNGVGGSTSSGNTQFRNYLEYHATQYQLLNPQIKVNIQQVDTADVNADTNTADAVIVPSNVLGTLVETNTLWDMTDYIIEQQQQKQHPIGASSSTTTATSTRAVAASGGDSTSMSSINVDWFDILPFVRYVSATYPDQTGISSSGSGVGSDTDMTMMTSTSKSMTTTTGDADGDNEQNSSRIRLIPLDGDVLHMFYRRDLFERHNIKVPRTWDEYQQAAEYFHGQPWGPNGTILTGSCVSRARTVNPFTATATNGQCNAYWTSLVLSSMTQTKGSTDGYLLDPKTAQPILGQAMEETLRILSDQNSVGPVEEIILGTTNDNTDNVAACGQVNALLTKGTCALTYNWGSQLTMDVFDDAENWMQQLQVGVAPTPGSTHVYNRETERLEKCTAQLCPFGIHYPDIGIVNRSPYSAFGGWMGGVSNGVADSQKKAAADFISYMSNPKQSLPDVLPNPRSNFVQPYRYSHTRSSSYTEVGFNTVLSEEYTDAVQAINSQNTVMDVRITPGVDLRSILDEEVHSYLLKMHSNVTTVAEANALRTKITTTIDEKMQQSLALVEQEVSLADTYRSSIGVDNTSGDSMNYIEPQYKSAGWGLGGLICCVSFLLMIWTMWNRRNQVMKAFQPPLLLISALGLFLMGGTIIPLGFDDSIFNDDVLDITCMASPWIYIMGFTVFFSSVYSKILVCLRIYKTPGENDVLLVRLCDYFQALVPILVVNGSSLAVWTALYPLKWVRQPVEDGEIFSDGTVETYGSCRGENFEFFALAFFVFNLILCFVGTLQAFQCRFLVLEYNEMQWLPLSLLPFFEAWIVGGPVLVFLKEDPTTTFIVMTIVIGASSICGALAVFAPKDWYIRKFHKVLNVKSNEDLEQGHTHPHPSPPNGGVLVLKHPTVSGTFGNCIGRCQCVRLMAISHPSVVFLH
jgi:multiple sugar transport system substrate-binding protein